MSSLRSNTPDPDDPSDSTLGTVVNSVPFQEFLNFFYTVTQLY